MKRIVSVVAMVGIVAGSLMALAPAAKAADVDGEHLGSTLAAPPAYAAPPPPPVYYAPAPSYARAPVYTPAPVDVDEPECRLIREQYWDGYGYRTRRVQVCD
jgi:hypothetical protein